MTGGIWRLEGKYRSEGRYGVGNRSLLFKSQKWMLLSSDFCVGIVHRKGCSRAHGSPSWSSSSERMVLCYLFRAVHCFRVAIGPYCANIYPYTDFYKRNIRIINWLREE